ncbi:MAG: hypothetical protein LQ347_003802 [Umbilicaria vellea]|nr:MAG: hypothetical protein LQ347_003802 [Umbilicaria vellea]
MPPFRNPFGRRPPPTNDLTPGQGENTPGAALNGQAKEPQRSDLTSSRTSSALSIRANKDEPNEFKLSGINSSNHRSMLSENEPFSISRESFDSYRRSFDISARSPVLPAESNPPRQSLDSRTSRMPRSAINGSGRFERPQPTDEEGFEDVGLNDDAKPKKRGIFSRFADSADPSASDDSSRPSSSHRGFHLPGRKRGQSGQGAELGNINKPTTNADDIGIIR